MYYSTLPETNSSHLKIRQNPKGNDRLPIIHFQMRKLLVSGSLIEFTFQVSGIHPMRCVATIPPSDRPIKSIGAGQGQGRWCLRRYLMGPIMVMKHPQEVALQYFFGGGTIPEGLWPSLFKKKRCGFTSWLTLHISPGVFSIRGSLCAKSGAFWLESIYSSKSSKVSKRFRLKNVQWRLQGLKRLEDI